MGQRTAGLLLVLAMIGGCSTMEGTHTPSPLSEQILKLRPAHQGLSFRYCKQTDTLGQCKVHDVIEYPPTEELAKELQKLKFACKAYEQRYKPCFMEGSFGFCQVTYNGLWGPWKKRLIEYIELSANKERLLNANLRCFNYELYHFPDM